MLVKDGVDIELSDVGGRVEEKRKPANPRGQLDLADFRDLRRQILDGLEHLPEKADDPRVSGTGRCIEPGIPFLDVYAADQQRRSERERGDCTQYFELCVSQKREVLWQMHVSKDIS